MTTAKQSKPSNRPSFLTDQGVPLDSLHGKVRLLCHGAPVGEIEKIAIDLILACILCGTDSKLEAKQSLAALFAAGIREIDSSYDEMRAEMCLPDDGPMTRQ